jgi:hypothetical protein
VLSFVGDHIMQEFNSLSWPDSEPIKLLIITLNKNLILVFSISSRSRDLTAHRTSAIVKNSIRQILRVKLKEISNENENDSPISVYSDFLFHCFKSKIIKPSGKTQI